MFHYLTLNFKQPSLEAEYRKEQQPRINQEYTYFAIQCAFFFPFYLLAYFQESYFNLWSVLIIAIVGVMIVLFKILIEKTELGIVFVLPFLQILLFLVWNVDSFVQPQRQLEYSKYTWIQGFQACYLHIALIQQGYQILPQGVAILIVHIVNSIYFASQTLEFASETLKITSVLIGVITIKYSNEKLKRMQFIDNRERNKWIKIIEQIVDYQIIVVSFDPKQDQLVIQHMKEETRERLQIQDNIQFRQFIRDIQILNSGLSQSKFKTDSLEMEIRKLFTSNTQLTVPSFEVISNNLKQEFRVKLVSYIFQEIQCVLLVFDSETRKELKQTAIKAKIIENLFSSNTSKLLQALQQDISRTLIIQSLVNLQLFKIWINEKSFVSDSIAISTHLLLQRLRNLFHKPITYNNELNGLQPIQINLKLLEMILVGITQIVDQQFRLNVKFKNSAFYNCLKFEIIYQQILLPQSQFNKIRRLIDFNDSNWKKNRQQIIEYMISEYQFQKLHQLDFIFILIMCQYLLWKGFDKSVFQFKNQKNKIFFDIIINI